MIKIDDILHKIDEMDDLITSYNAEKESSGFSWNSELNDTINRLRRIIDSGRNKKCQ